MNDDGWVEVGAAPQYPMWDENANKSTMGKYVDVRRNVGKNNSTIYVLEVDAQGTRMGVWGSTVLDARFENIEIGSLVKIEYLGKTKGKDSRGEYKNYKVFSKNADGSQPAAPATTATTPSETENKSKDDLPF